MSANDQSGLVMRNNLSDFYQLQHRDKNQPDHQKKRDAKKREKQYHSYCLTEMKEIFQRNKSQIKSCQKSKGPQCPPHQPVFIILPDELIKFVQENLVVCHCYLKLFLFNYSNESR